MYSKILTVKLLSAGVALLGASSVTAGAAAMPNPAQPAASGLLSKLGLSTPGETAKVKADVKGPAHTSGDAKVKIDRVGTGNIEVRPTVQLPTFRCCRRLHRSPALSPA